MSDISFENIDWNRLGDPAYLISIGVDPTIAVTPPSGSPGPTTVGGIVQNNLSGRAVVQAILRGAGLDITPDLEQYVTNLATNYANDLTRLGAVVNADLYDTGSTLGKVVDQKYPELALRTKNGFGFMSVGDAIDYRRTAQQVARAEGYPTELLDYKKLISQNVGLPELQTRIRDNYGAVRDAMPEVVDQLHTLYNLTPGDISALVSDPAETSAHLLRRFQSAQIAAAGVGASYGQIGAGTAEQLAAQGVTDTQARQGFGSLAQLRQLLNPITGEAGFGGISQEQQLAAEFGGNADAQRLIEEQRARRKASFAGGGGFGVTQRGLGGGGLATTS